MKTDRSTYYLPNAMPATSHLLKNVTSQLIAEQYLMVDFDGI